MKRIKRYEQLYINFIWAFIIMNFIFGLVVQKYFLSDDKIGQSMIQFNLSYLIFCSVFNLSKHILNRRRLFENNRFYFYSRVLELFMITFGIVFAKMGFLAYIFIFFTVLITSLCKGRRQGFLLVFYSFFIVVVFEILNTLIFSQDKTVSFDDNVLNKFVFLVFIYALLLFFAAICAKIYKDVQDSENENSKLCEEIQEKYSQLSIAQEEIKFHYDKIKDTNAKLEDANNKLRNSVAEFFTLQQISQAIGAILDINELLKHVNDIILGVMGVSYSSIILYDDKRNRLKLHTTSITSKCELITLNDNINSPILLQALNEGKQIMENDADPTLYEFTAGRGVKSLICVPLSSKNHKFGLVVVEQKFSDAFDEENLRMLDIIGQQVGMTMENADLYQKMHELATIDGLTGVFNRLYFNERLKSEFESAIKGNYPISLAIFDIDFFKKFNDTYGHIFGDQVIKHIAGLVRDSLRSSDLIARFGGEEFVILFPRTELMDAYEKAEVIRKAIEKTKLENDGVVVSITVSIGVSCYPMSCSSESELLRKADDALYDAKSSGRNVVKTAKSVQE